MLTDLQKRTAQAIVNIFETGRVLGDYGKVTLLSGDSGHLTYGRSQTTLTSGNLHLLINAYCAEPGAAYASRLRRFLKRLADKDTQLDRDPSLRDLLADAGQDPVMHDVQDRFFDRVYWEPSIRDATAIGASTPLGTATVYDGHVHGSWHALRDLTNERHGTLANLGEEVWTARYVAERRYWLANHARAGLHATVYRMDALKVLIDAGQWALPLPLSVRGVTIDQDTLLSGPPVRASAYGDDERTLLLRTPQMRGEDVESLQRALTASGFVVEQDGVFGRSTDRAVREAQRSHGLKDDGIVGPATRSALGLSQSRRDDRRTEVLMPPKTASSLKYTLVLPSDNGPLAKQLFEAQIADLNLVLMVVLGDRQDLVTIADMRAAAYPNVRRVVWVTNPNLPELAQRIAALNGGQLDVIVVALGFNDQPVVRLRKTDTVDPLAIEAAFFKAQASA